MLDWSLKLADWLMDHRSGPHPVHRIAEPADRSPFPSSPAGLSPDQLAAGAGAVVGLLRRPQDHNGIVDDTVTLVSPFVRSSTDFAGACALAAFLSAVVDGWHMEGALAQSLFVAKRGETFGEERGPSVAQAMEEAMDRVYASKDPDEAVRRVFLANADPESGEQDEIAWIPPVARAIALAYVAREPSELWRLLEGLHPEKGHEGSALQADSGGLGAGVGASHDAGTGGLRSGGATGVSALEAVPPGYYSAVAAMLTAAHKPEDLPDGTSRDVEERTDVAELLDELLELRVARYQRVPQYAARFRRKKC